jgi:glycosyltransferase involved in cell wall biosynthesis
MTKPMISVIIPTYNRAAFLPEAVDSVLQQTFKNFELIVVDDGSTDETRQLLETHSGRLRYHFQTNQGVSAARNQGLRLAQGRWIAFLDSDDFWLPEKLGVQMDFFLKNGEALICQTEEIWLRNGRRVNSCRKHQKPSGDVFAPSLYLCLISPSAVMIRKELFSSLGTFDEALPACEDYDLWLRIAAHYPVYLIDRPLVVKRGGHADQLSRTIPTLDRYRIRSLMKLLESGDLTASQHDLVLKVLKGKCRIYGEGCLKRRKIEEGQYYLNLPERIEQSLRP